MSLRTRRAGSARHARDLDSEQGVFLQALVDKARLLTGGQAAALCLVDPSSTRMLLAAGSGSFADQVGKDAPAHAGLSGRMLAAPGPVTCSSCDAACCPFAPSSGHQHLAVPIEAPTGLRGVLCATAGAAIATRQHSGATLTGLARLAGSCLADEPVCELAEDLGALTERQKIAADMHDSIAQHLVALHAQVDSVLSELPAESWPRLIEVRETLSGTIDELRAMIESLRSPRDRAEAPVGLATVLGAAAQDVGVAANLILVRAEQDIWVPQPVAAEVRRIVTEALTNADRHGRASTITVDARLVGPHAIVSVADNGSGLAGGHSGTTSAMAAADGWHFGIDMMRLRAAVIGGELEIRPGPGGGTEVVLRWRPGC